MYMQFFFLFTMTVIGFAIVIVKLDQIRDVLEGSNETKKAE